MPETNQAGASIFERARTMGIQEGYHDVFGNWRPCSEAASGKLLQSMGSLSDIESGGSCGPDVCIVRQGAFTPLENPSELILEDGTVLDTGNALPLDLPLGYHELRSLKKESRPTRLIVVPERSFLPADLKTWGFALQLYSLRSKASWGMGDLADLERFGRLAGKLHAGFLQVNPLHAVSPVTPQQTSPYYPGSRRFNNLLYLRIENIAGAAEAGVSLEEFSAQGRALNRASLIDRDACFKLKLTALEKIWSLRNKKEPGFESYRLEQGRALDQFALFCALSEHYGPDRADWARWDAEHRRPDAAGLIRFAADHKERIDFHIWVQWLLDKQMQKAGEALPLMQDLPIGFDPGGADAWTWQDLLAAQVSIGAPPDEYNRQGQDWGLRPFIPHKLRAVAYEPLRQTLSACLRHAKGLRIDHVMGLFRLFWIPSGMGPECGAYVRYPAEEILGIIALESHKAKAYVVGEDLGTVEDGVRERLGDQCVMSNRLLWFESTAPEAYPEQALASVTTHDLPTVAGLWTGADVAIQKELGLNPHEEGITGIRDRLRNLLGIATDAPVEEVVVKTYAALGKAPCRLLAVALEDALAVERRPNLPGTVLPTNWSVPLPVTLEEMEKAELIRKVAEVMTRSPMGSG